MSLDWRNWQSSRSASLLSLRVIVGKLLPWSQLAWLIVLSRGAYCFNQAVRRILLLKWWRVGRPLYKGYHGQLLWSWCWSVMSNIGFHNCNRRPPGTKIPGYFAKTILARSMNKSDLVGSKHQPYIDLPLQIFTMMQYTVGDGFNKGHKATKIATGNLKLV